MIELIVLIIAASVIGFGLFAGWLGWKVEMDTATAKASGCVCKDSTSIDIAMIFCPFHKRQNVGN